MKITLATKKCFDGVTRISGYSMTEPLVYKAGEKEIHTSFPIQEEEHDPFYQKSYIYLPVYSSMGKRKVRSTMDAKTLSNFGLYVNRNAGHIFLEDAQQNQFAIKLTKQNILDLGQFFQNAIRTMEE